MAKNEQNKFPTTDWMLQVNKQTIIRFFCKSVKRKRKEDTTTGRNKFKLLSSIEDVTSGLCQVLRLIQSGCSLMWLSISTVSHCTFTSFSVNKASADKNYNTDYKRRWFA